VQPGVINTSLTSAIGLKQDVLTSTNTIGVFNSPNDFVVNGTKIELSKNTSNYVLSTSKMLVNRIVTDINIASNYVLSTSNILVNRILEEDIFGSNYTKRLDGQSSNYVLSTSNILVKRITDEETII
jgi:hypothetical protein